MSYASEQGILNTQWNAAGMDECASSERLEKEQLSKMFEVVKGTNAKFGRDGDSFYYIVGNLPEPDCIVGFGNTPRNALENFYKAFNEGK